MNVILYTDSACEPDKRGAQTPIYGFAAFNEDAYTELFRGCGVVTSGVPPTNNSAEYHAIGCGLKQMQELYIAPTTLVIRTDNRFIVNQVSGQYACEAEHLQRLRARLMERLEGIDWSIELIPREENEIAHKLVCRAYEKHTGRKFPHRSRP